MNTLIFTVYDSAAGKYLDIFSAPSIEFAIREFRSAVNKEGHQFNMYPTDYTLFVIGEFDAEAGTVHGDPPKSLGVAVTFVDRIEREQLDGMIHAVKELEA